MATHKVVKHDEWLKARKKHLAKEKEFTRLRDQLSRERRELPWELVAKDYVFEGERGRQSLPDLFEGRSQLVIYHAMFNPETAGPSTSWTRDAACWVCSFWMDDFNYRMEPRSGSEAPGISVFLKDDDGRIFHTYSTYARGLDMLNVAYHYMDLAPKGRDEGDSGITWLRRRDEYPD